MKFRNLPSIVTLIAGLFVCIITIIYQYPIEQALWIVAIVMIIFYLIGFVLRKILNKTFEERPILDESEDDSDLDGNSNLKI